jgi:hypothetical protein
MHTTDPKRCNYVCLFIFKAGMKMVTNQRSTQSVNESQPHIAQHSTRFRLNSNLITYLHLDVTCCITSDRPRVHGSTKYTHPYELVFEKEMDSFEKWMNDREMAHVDEENQGMGIL